MTRTAVAAAGLTLALAVGCSDDSYGGGEAADGDFCGALEEAFAGVGSGEDVSLTEGAGAEAIEALTALEPPAEIADDFDTFVGYLESVASGDIPDDQTTDAWYDATERINTFAAEECGLTG